MQVCSVRSIPFLVRRRLRPSSGSCWPSRPSRRSSYGRVRGHSRWQRRCSRCSAPSMDLRSPRPVANPATSSTTSPCSPGSSWPRVSSSGSAVLSTSSDRLLRALTAAYGLVFLASSLQNFGLRLSLGPLDFYFGEPIWQAGAGEAVIGILVAAAVRESRPLYWTAYVLAVPGIAVGLSSVRLFRAARGVPVILAARLAI